MTIKNWDERLTEQIPCLLRYAKALTRNNTVAEDLVQDCLERAWRKRLLWNPQRELRPWLFTIMHNIYINQLNKRSVQLLTLPDESIITEQSDDQSQQMLLRDFEDALGKLNAEYREIILLAGLENLSYKEIAKITDLPIGTVMSRLSRAREKLRQLMDGTESDNVEQLR